MASVAFMEDSSNLVALPTTNPVAKRGDVALGVKVARLSGGLWAFYPVWTLGRFDYRTSSARWLGASRPNARV